MRGGSNLSGPAITRGIERHLPILPTEGGAKLSILWPYNEGHPSLRTGHTALFVTLGEQNQHTALHSGKDLAVSLPHFGGHIPPQFCSLRNF